MPAAADQSHHSDDHINARANAQWTHVSVASVKECTHSDPPRSCIPAGYCTKRPSNAPQTGLWPTWRQVGLSYSGRWPNASSISRAISTNIGSLRTAGDPAARRQIRQSTFRSGSRTPLIKLTGTAFHGRNQHGPPPKLPDNDFAFPWLHFGEWRDAPIPLRWHLREHRSPEWPHSGQPTAGCARELAVVKEALPKLRSHRSVRFT